MHVNYTKLALIFMAAFAGAALAAVFIALIVSAPGAGFMLAVVLLPLAWGGIMIGCLVAATTFRRRPTDALAALAQAVRLNLPLPEVFRSLPRDEFDHGFSGAISALDSGSSVSDAMAQIPRMPRQIVAAIAWAERSGRLPQVMERIMRYRRDSAAAGVARLSFNRIYPLFLVAILVTVISILLIFVVPKFEQIIKDFGTAMPDTTRYLLSFADGFGPIVGVTLVFGLAAYSVYNLNVMFHLMNSDLSESVGGMLLNQLPFFGRVRFERSLSEALEFIGDGIAAGRPMHVAIADAVPLTSNGRVAACLREWSDEVEAGESIAGAARIAGLPRSVCSMLKASAQSADLQPAFDFLARYYATRFSRSLALLEALRAPAIALVGGFFVAWVAASMLLPMTRLIEQASPYPFGT